MNPATSISRSPGRSAWRADLLLLLAALIWGSGFVAQRAVSEHLGPFTFNAIRNVISAAALLPFVLRWGGPWPFRGPAARTALLGGVGAGLALFAGGWLQQAGIAHTTAGNAGFITGLYVVLVPILAATAGARLPSTAWPAAALATVGLYLLSATDRWTLGRGDLLVLASAFFWALHVHAVGYFSPRMNALWLTWLQVAVAAVLSLPLAFATESIPAGAVRATLGPLLYAGIACGALGFALQVRGQRDAPPAHAALLMSLEAVFAAVFGWLLLDERLGIRGFVGALVMLAGMLVSQWPQLRPRLTLPAGGATSAVSGTTDQPKERNQPWV